MLRTKTIGECQKVPKTDLAIPVDIESIFEPHVGRSFAKVVGKLEEISKVNAPIGIEVTWRR